MKFKHILTLFFTTLGTAQTGATNAPATQGNAELRAYQATLQASKPIQGYITGVSGSNGTGITFTVNFSSFPDASDGPFAYHIHQYPIPSTGNCTAAGPHLDPYLRGDTTPCNAGDPSSCQVGDLSGKHGLINDTTTEHSFERSYLDLYLSDIPDTSAFFGNRSVVVHAKNGTRLNCGNFVKIELGIVNNGTMTITSTGMPGPGASSTVASSGIGSAMATNSAASTAGPSASASASGIGAGTNQTSTSQQTEVTNTLMILGFVSLIISMML